jgi:hypothetical protein
MHGDEVKHQMKFNMSASLLEELSWDLIPYFSLSSIEKKTKKINRFQSYSQVLNLNSMHKTSISINIEITVYLRVSRVLCRRIWSSVQKSLIIITCRTNLKEVRDLSMFWYMKALCDIKVILYRCCYQLINNNQIFIIVIRPLVGFSFSWFDAKYCFFQSLESTKKIRNIYFFPSRIWLNKMPFIFLLHQFIPLQISPRTNPKPCILFININIFISYF